MRLPLSALAVLLLHTCIALADPDTDLRDLQTLQTPTLSAEELKQVLFKATLDARSHEPLLLELHNPFRDKSLRGIVVHVESKSADGKAQSMDIFADLECGPLQTGERWVPLFNAEELLPRAPVITLKEVHRALRVESERDSGDMNILQTATFSPEEMKELLVRLTLSDATPPQIVVEMHNPFRDKSVRGIVLQVEYKLADGKERSLEIFENLECRPLSNAVRVVSFHNAAEIDKASPVITLKEVHRGE